MSEQRQQPGEAAAVAGERAVAAPDGGEDGKPTLRLCRIPAAANAASCGFHISRTQWDPYPWVSAVEVGSPAEQAGLRSGDCVLEVNGEDVLGQRIGEVASKVRAARAKERLQLLVWNAGCDPGTAVTLTAGSAPTPLNLQLLSSCLQQCSQLLECPVCLESVSPPVWQCCHGHLLCSGCRSRSDRCPLCRVPLGPRGRSLLADKLHELLGQTFRRYNDQRVGQPAAPAEGAATTTTTANNDQRTHVPTRGLRLSASSEDVSAEAARAESPGTGHHQVAVVAAPPARGTGRQRSHSAGHIGEVVRGKEAAADGGLLGVVHCPYGSVCTATCPAADIFHHLSEDHEGPLTQYFPREGRQLILPHPKQGESAPSSLTVLTTKAGDTLFLHSERGLLWLWSLVSSNTTDTSSTATLTPGMASSCPDFGLCVDFPDDEGDAQRRTAVPVFPLTASSEDVIATGRCVRLSHQDLRVHMRVADSTPGAATTAR